MSVLDVLRGVTKGVGGAVGNQDVVNDITQQQDRERQAKQNDLKAQMAPHVQAMNSLRTEQMHITDPKTGLPIKGYEQQYNELTDQMQGHIHAVRGIAHPDHVATPLENFRQHLTDRMHITNGLKRANDQSRKQEQGEEKDRSDTQTFMQGAEPGNDFTKKFAQAEQAGATPDQMEELKKETFNPMNARQKPLLKNFIGPNKEIATFDANRPEEIPNGWTLAPNETNNTRSRADYEEFKKSHPEYKGSFEEWAKNPSGVAKPLTPSVQYTNLLAKKILADGKQGPPLTNEENAQLQASKSALTVAGIAKAEAFAQAAAKNNLIAATVDGQDVLVTREQGVKASNSGNPLVAGVVSSPTAHDKTTQAFAQSGLDRLKEMRSIVNAHPEVFGPAAGRTMKASVWLGSQSPEAQKFQNDAQFLAEHSTAVFGGRAASTVEAMKNIMANPNTNPEALLAGFDSDEATLNDFVNPGGRLTGPQGPGAKALNDMKGKGGQHQYAIDENGKRRKVLDPKAQLPQGWKWAD
jgi:hypothetical protein